MRWLVALLLALAAAAPALADEIRPFSIEFTERSEGQWTLDWKQPIGQTSIRRVIVPQIPANCAFDGDPVTRAVPMAVIGHARALCRGPVAGQEMGLAELLGNSDALLIVNPLDRPVQTHRLTAQAPLAQIAARPDRWRVLSSYFAIGTEHILMGWDHLLFVIALVLLVEGGWAVVKAATAFTVAHSLTLAAVTLGVAGLPQRPVEALIALSIVFLAVELARADRESWTRKWPWLVAFAFGLLHGFGFAGALQEIGLPEGEVPAALLAFNLGVEAGQLLVIAALMLLRWSINRLAPRAEPGALRLATYAIGITASYWLVERLVG